MLFTRETDYAIRIVRALRDGEKHSITEICEAEKIPESFAYKVMRKLSRDGIVDSRRGVTGGYILNLPLTDLTLHDIVVAIEPDFAVMRCIHHFCDRNGADAYCRVHTELMKVQDSLETQLKERTLKEILG